MAFQLSDSTKVKPSRDTKPKARQTLVDSLKGDQVDAFQEIKENLLDEDATERKYALTGYAGTGKTYLIGAIVEYASKNDYTVSVTAPTHQAKRMIAKHLPAKAPWTEGTHSSTIHSFLGLTLSSDGRGGYKLVKESEISVSRSTKSLVIVDEGSMIGGELWAHIEAALNSHGKMRFLFVGDPAQLPPVGDEESPALQVQGPRMEEVLRQAEGNPIIRAATAIRKGLDWRDEAVFFDGSGIFTTGHEAAFAKSAAERIAESKDPYTARVLAGRNRVVDTWNHRIKDHLYPDTNEWVEGMWGIAYETWGPSNIPIVTNSQLVQIKRAEKKMRDVEGLYVPVWHLKAKPEGRTDTVELLVLDSGSSDVYENELQTRLNIALDEGGGSWRNYYNLKEALCDLRYPYASTVHKAQGSTYDTAYIDERDLRTFPGDEPVKRSLYYVAFTRASDRVAVLE
jgi:exodeoxyribonuclease-5